MSVLDAQFRYGIFARDVVESKPRKQPNSKKMTKRKRIEMDPMDKKARQAEKNRQTARRFRAKMENLRIYLDDQVVSLMCAYRSLVLLVLKYGKTPKSKEPWLDGVPIRRCRTSHF